jgi:hypothetical protein
MYIFIFCIALIIAPIYAIGKAISGKSSPAPPKAPVPKQKDPIDRHMDENYADVDWLRKGKL